MRKRIQKLIAKKVKGQEIEAPEPERRAPAEIVDLMSALKASLAARGAKSAPKTKAARPKPRRQERRAS